MDLGTFHAAIKDICQRGDTLDSIIPTYTRIAAKFIETNHNFLQMKKSSSLAAVAGSREITPPTTLVKRILDINYENTDGSLTHLTMYDSPKLHLNFEEDFPKTMWQADGKYYLGEIPNADYTLTRWAYEYTTWPTANAGTNYILEEYEGILLAQTIIQMAPSVRNKELNAEFADLWKIQWRIALIQDYELTASLKDERMNGQ